MSFQYNFPAIKAVDEAHYLYDIEVLIRKQYDKICEEVTEMEKAWALLHMGMIDEEVMDVLHACETYFRLREKLGYKPDEIQKQVEDKNRERGYYGNGAKVGI